MFKNCKMLFQAIAYLFFFSSCDLTANEIDLSGASERIDGPYFFVNIFDGYMPVPSRYVLYPGKIGADRIMLISDGQPGITKFPKKIVGDSGTINFGDIMLCDLCQNPGKIDRDLFHKKSEYSYNELKILILESSFGSTHVYIYDKSYYAFISDEDDNLWRTMLKGLVKYQQ